MVIHSIISDDIINHFKIDFLKNYFMKLNLEQRSKLFEIVKKHITNNKDKVNIISSDHPNMSFVYNDDDYKITYFYNQFALGITTGDVVQITLYDKKYKNIVKFDSGDYIFMKNRKDMLELVEYIHINIFKYDKTDNDNQIIINKILGL